MSIFNPPNKYQSPVEILESRVRRYPISRDPTHYIERRTYIQDAAFYVPLLLSSQIPGGASAYLVDQDIIERNGNLIKFWRDYATVPATRRDPTSMVYEFPGYSGEERQPFQISVDCEVEFAYFLIGGPDGLSDMGDIPHLTRQRYLLGDNETRYLGDGTGSRPATTPTMTEYKQMITNKDEIRAEDSHREVYLGNIIVRRTPYIIAQ